MSPVRRSNPELDELIEQITVDCYSEDEELTAFEVAFEQAAFPCHGSVVGEDVEVLAISAVANPPGGSEDGRVCCGACTALHAQSSRPGHPW